ncbi:hypothetical protein Gasu2_54920 [Galdieria sulphuraria]|nr:hypothetical protein Gasu2_54920 [Galdieria sulphuraria]
MNAFDPSFEQKLIPCTQPIVLVVGFDFGKNGGTFDYAFYRNAVNQGILVLQSPEFVKFLQHCEWNVEERSLSFQADSGVYSETTCLYLSEALPTKCQVKLQLDQWKLWFPVHHGNVEVRSFPIEPSSKIIQEKCIFSTTLT